MSPTERNAPERQTRARGNDTADVANNGVFLARFGENFKFADAVLIEDGEMYAQKLTAISGTPRPPCDPSVFGQAPPGRYDQLPPLARAVREGGAE